VATVVRATPSVSGRAQLGLGAGFPVTVLAATKTVAGVVWHQVLPRTVAPAKVGWVPASILASTKPPGTTSAGVEALAPALKAYLTRLGTNVGVTVFDMTRGVTYRYDSSRPFITASSVKVPIMLAFLRQLEAAHRRPTKKEVALLTAMIEHSDNDAASALDLAVGGPAGLQHFAKTFRLTGFQQGRYGGWGWGTLTTDAMTRLLALFEQGKVLSSAADTKLARTLMRNVQEDQRFGVGWTAPAGATVLLKDGWVPGPDGLWVANSSGIVISRHATWVIAVYTAHLSSLEDGKEILDHVCAAVADRLR
jgi:Beta-lactamase class A